MVGANDTAAIVVEFPPNSLRPRPLTAATTAGRKLTQLAG
jgi:hypothetical protein